CQNCKKDFVIEQEDFNFYEKIKVPPPTFCPECRTIRRLCWRNERSLFHRICDFSGQKVITMFHPSSKIIVYDRDIWWGDKWDPAQYGQDYDFSRPFFEQFQELLHKVPLASLGNTHVINSTYGNHNLDCKDCFLLYASYDNERVHYSQGALKLKDCIDTYSLLKSSFCYEDVLSGSLYQTHFSYDSDESINSYFLKSCVNCQNCIGCMNLRNKSYCIFNEQYTIDEYLKIKNELNFGNYKSLTDFKKKYKDFVLQFPHRYAGIIKSKDCTGDNILNSKNTKYSFDIYGNVEDSKFVAHGVDCKDSYDCYGFGIGSLLYEVVDCGNQSGSNYFSVLAHGCLNTTYVYMCYNSKNIFGSIGIRKGEYYILNKKYSKEEYEELIPKIIKHMNDMPYVDKKSNVYKYGEFFPSEISLFAYNETIAQEYFSKTKEQIAQEGYIYRKPLEKKYDITLKTKNIPNDINDIKDFIIDEVIECPNKGNELTQCTEAFKIRKDELDFLRKNNIALPRFCPNCRHYERLKQRNPMKLWHRQCMCDKKEHAHGDKKCEVEFETSYAPDRSEIIYCEKCYQQEVY
ncbi:MAG: hypothetical protein WCX46_00410, partial [Candidatus Paceibacterota bacterium]